MALPVVTVSRIAYRQNKKNTCAVSVVVGCVVDVFQHVDVL